MTETIMNVSNPCDGERRPGTVGLPLPGVELRLAGGDQGEVLLLEHPGVAEVAVVGAPSEEWGEQVAAFVVPADPAAPPDRDELLAFAAERLAGFKRPRVLRYVEPLPRNALGKVLKHELRP
jgi:malonyl-CoA/methylmalonyl-CoA synthetase